jgi:hypothetical protein
MVNVFCTRKTESLITVEKKRENYNPIDENWLCNLIAVGGKKSLYFIDKKTLYSILLLNVKKKDLQNIESLFIEEFISQLKIDGILNPEKELIIRNKFSEITFYETDNDQKTLGTCNYSGSKLAIVLKACKIFCPFLIHVSVTERITA